MEKVLVHSQVTQESQKYSPVSKTWENREYIIVPVVMMVEGVHSGSRGPLLHLASELGKIVDAWNGIPITLNHPVQDESYVSANSPQVLSEYYIGRVFNAQMDGNKLKAEAWFDVQNLTSKSPDSLAKIQAGEIMEVSVGVFSEEEITEGIHNNESYVAIARNLRPDHLALLPGQTGACSVNDGCGLRVNKKKGGLNVIEINHDLFKNLSKQNYNVIPFTVNATGLMETVDKVRDALYSRDSSTEYYYLEDIFPGYVIYRKRVKQEVSEGVYSEVSNDLYKETYTINEGLVSFMNDPVKVLRKIEYPVINKKEVKMCEPCKEKVNALIAHTSTHFTENDREWLDTLTEDKLDKLIPKVVQTNAKAPTLEDAWNVINANARSIEDYTAKLPEAIKKQIDLGLNSYKEMRNGVNQNIIANTEEGTWTVEELDAMPLETLQKIEKSVTKDKGAADFTVQGVSAYKKEDGGITPMLPSGFEA